MSSGHVKSVLLSTAGSLSSETRSVVETQTTRIGLSSFTAPETIQTAKTTKHDYKNNTSTPNKKNRESLVRIMWESCHSC